MPPSRSQSPHPSNRHPPPPRLHYRRPSCYNAGFALQPCRTSLPTAVPRGPPRLHSRRRTCYIADAAVQLGRMSLQAVIMWVCWCCRPARSRTWEHARTSMAIYTRIGIGTTGRCVRRRFTHCTGIDFALVFHITGLYQYKANSDSIVRNYLLDATCFS
jgi:hypothetical protein